MSSVSAPWFSAGQLVCLKIGDVPGTPKELASIRLVYALGAAEDVLVITDDADLTVRQEYVSAMEEEAVRVALIYAEKLTPATIVFESPALERPEPPLYPDREDGS